MNNFKGLCEKYLSGKIERYKKNCREFYPSSRIEVIWKKGAKK